MIWATEEERQSPAALDTKRQVIEIQLAMVLELVTPAAHSVDRTCAERRPRPAIPLGRDSSCPFLGRISGSGILLHGALPRDMAHVARIPRNILSLVPRTVDKQPSTPGGQARGIPAAHVMRAPAASPRSIEDALHVIAIAE